MTDHLHGRNSQQSLGRHATNHHLAQMVYHTRYTRNVPVQQDCCGFISKHYGSSKGIISNSWRKAEGIFIPKEDGAVKVEKFRTISFLNVEPKLSFAILAKKMINFTLQNGYIDTATQKGRVLGVFGCL